MPASKKKEKKEYYKKDAYVLVFTQNKKPASVVQKSGVVGEQLLRE